MESLTLEFDSVTKRLARSLQRRSLAAYLFRGGTRDELTLFSEVTLKVRPGEKILVLGPNGVGKTTFLRLAGGLVRPSRGRVHVDGKRVEDCPRRYFGHMFSTSLLYQRLTGYRNLEYSGYLHFDAGVESLIHRTAERWGIAARLDQMVASYSRGYMALLALARATLHSPAVLLLDEPTAYLDAEHLGRLTDFLAESPATILAASQDKKLAPYFDRIVELRVGKPVLIYDAAPSGAA